MNSNSTLISLGQFDLKVKHLLIIGILSLSFSMSFLIRSQPVDWGWELAEFDPFFNYRATQYIVENGLDSYFQWNDELSWYPDGRDVSQTSQIMLHVTAATTYWIFGAGGNLYDFTILFPAVIGSLTCIVIFALVRVIGGTTAGLFSALFFSISLPILIRGQIGWFKSEPLGLFYGLLAAYLFLSGIKSKNYKIAASKVILSGILLGFGFASWGGIQFFVIPIGLFVMSLPFLRNDTKFLFWSIPLFMTSAILTTISFDRPGIYFITSLGGFGLIIPTLIMILLLIVKTFSNNPNRNMLLTILAFSIIIFSIFLSGSEFLPSTSFRYLNALNPFLTTTDPLVDSVSEHTTTSIQQSFIFHSVLMIFAGLGIWLVLKHSKYDFIKNDMISFSLIFGLTGIYISSAFVRLEVFASISVIILSSLGLSIISKEFLSKKPEISKLKNFSIKSGFMAGLIILLVTPLVISPNSTTFALTDNPQTIVNGGTAFKVSSSDWTDSLEWIKNNTPKDSVIASWWDYGYWIQTKAERATLADNSTLSTEKIKKIAQIFLSEPEEGWKSLEDMGADYFVLFVAAQRYGVDGSQNQSIYNLGGGGDESKKQWFMRIAGEPLGKYLYNDGISGTDTFWNETLMGKMIPFEPIGYVNFQTNEQSLTFQPGFTPVYEKNIKFPENGNGPLKLVYSSHSFDTVKGGSIIGVLVYEINHDYVLSN